MSSPMYRRPFAFWTAVACVWWLLHGLASASHYRFLSVSVGSPVTWGHALTTAMVSAALWVPLTVGALWLVERFPIERQRWTLALAVHTAAAVAVVLLRAVIVVAANPWVEWYAVLPPFRQVLLTSVINNFFLYLLVVGAAHALHFARAARDRESQLARSQLQALTSQLQPHFLFNTLNTIAAMMHHDTAAADRMLARLSELLRRTLAAHDTPEVALRDELGFLSAYLEIETTRFADRLSVAWDVDPAALDMRVPYLILQPLVENAVRHGIAPRAAPGVIAISARCVGEWLHLEVRDDGVGLRGADSRKSDGVGLANVRGRLAQLHPQRHHLELAPGERGGTVLTLVIPAQLYTPARTGSGEARSTNAAFAPLPSAFPR